MISSNTIVTILATNKQARVITSAVRGDVVTYSLDDGRWYYAHEIKIANEN